MWDLSGVSSANELVVLSGADRAVVVTKACKAVRLVEALGAVVFRPDLQSEGAVGLRMVITVSDDRGAQSVSRETWVFIYKTT